MDFPNYKLQSIHTKIKPADARYYSKLLKYVPKNASTGNQTVLAATLEKGELEMETSLLKHVESNTDTTNINPSSASTAVLQRNGVNSSKSDEEIFERILEKLYTAYENLSPVIDEIISSAAAVTATGAQSLKYSNCSMCSVTQEQYARAIKASKLIQEVNNEVVHNSKNNMEITKGEVLHFPLADDIINTVQQSFHTTVEDVSVGTSKSRIYIEKCVVDQLVELYYLLHGALQQLYRIPTHKKISSNESDRITGTSKHTSTEKILQKSNNSLKQSNLSNDVDYPENSKKLAQLQEEYKVLTDTVNMLKSIIQETSGSAGDIRRFGKRQQDTRKSRSDNSVTEAEKSKKVTDISGARRCILECLIELAKVRKYLKSVNNTEELDMVNQIRLTGYHKKECCGRQNIPHLHAKLNGVPIVVKLKQETIDTILSSVESYPRYYNNEENNGNLGSYQTYKCIASKSSSILKATGQSTKMISSDKRKLSPKTRQDYGHQQKLSKESKSLVKYSKSYTHIKEKNSSLQNTYNNVDSLISDCQSIPNVSHSNSSNRKRFKNRKKINQNVINQGDYKINNNKRKTLKEKSTSISEKTFEKLKIAALPKTTKFLKNKSSSFVKSIKKKKSTNCYVLKINRSGELLEMSYQTNKKIYEGSLNSEIIVHIESFENFTGDVKQSSPTSSDSLLIKNYIYEGNKSSNSSAAETNQELCKLFSEFPVENVENVDKEFQNNIKPTSKVKQQESFRSFRLKNIKNLYEEYQIIINSNSKDQQQKINETCEPILAKYTNNIVPNPDYNINKSISAKIKDDNINLSNKFLQKNVNNVFNEIERNAPSISLSPTNADNIEENKYELSKVFSSTNLTNTPEENINFTKQFTSKLKEEVVVKKSVNFNTKHTRIACNKNNRLHDFANNRRFKKIARNGLASITIIEEEPETEGEKPNRILSKSKNTSKSTINRNVKPGTKSNTCSKLPSYKKNINKTNVPDSDSEPGIPYVVSIRSIPKLKKEKTRPNSKFAIKNGHLQNDDIYHSKKKIQQQLEQLGIRNLTQAGSIATCCRKSVLNEKPRIGLPYPVSLMSLPLDATDLEAVKQITVSHNSTKIYSDAMYDTYYSKLNYYSNLETDLKRTETKTYEVRFFELQRSYEPENKSLSPTNTTKKKTKTSNTKNNQSNISSQQTYYTLGTETTNKNSNNRSVYPNGVVPPWGEQSFEVRVFEFSRKGSKDTSDTDLPMTPDRRRSSNQRRSDTQDASTSKSRYYSYPDDEDYERVVANKKLVSERRPDVARLHQYRHGTSPLVGQPWAPFNTSDISLPAFGDPKNSVPTNKETSSYNTEDQKKHVETNTETISTVSKNIETDAPLLTASRVTETVKANQNKGVNTMTRAPGLKYKSQNVATVKNKQDLGIGSIRETAVLLNKISKGMETNYAKRDEDIDSLLPLLLKCLNYLQNNYGINGSFARSTCTVATSTTDINFEFLQRAPRDIVHATTSWNQKTTSSCEHAHLSSQAGKRNQCSQTFMQDVSNKIPSCTSEKYSKDKRSANSTTPGQPSTAKKHFSYKNKKIVESTHPKDMCKCAYSKDLCICGTSQPCNCKVKRGKERQNHNDVLDKKASSGVDHQSFCRNKNSVLNQNTSLHSSTCLHPNTVPQLPKLNNDSTANQNENSRNNRKFLTCNHPHVMYYLGDHSNNENEIKTSFLHNVYQNQSSSELSDNLATFKKKCAVVNVSTQCNSLLQTAVVKKDTIKNKSTHPTHATQYNMFAEQKLEKSSQDLSQSEMRNSEQQYDIKKPQRDNCYLLCIPYELSSNKNKSHKQKLCCLNNTQPRGIFLKNENIGDNLVTLRVNKKERKLNSNDIKNVERVQEVNQSFHKHKYLDEQHKNLYQGTENIPFDTWKTCKDKKSDRSSGTSDSEHSSYHTSCTSTVQPQSNKNDCSFNERTQSGLMKEKNLFVNEKFSLDDIQILGKFLYDPEINYFEDNTELILDLPHHPMFVETAVNTNELPYSYEREKQNSIKNSNSNNQISGSYKNNLHEWNISRENCNNENTFGSDKEFKSRCNSNYTHKGNLTAQQPTRKRKNFIQYNSIGTNTDYPISRSLTGTVIKRQYSDQSNSLVSVDNRYFNDNSVKYSIPSDDQQKLNFRNFSKSLLICSNSTAAILNTPQFKEVQRDKTNSLTFGNNEPYLYEVFSKCGIRRYNAVLKRLANKSRIKRAVRKNESSNMSNTEDFKCGGHRNDIEKYSNPFLASFKNVHSWGEQHVTNIYTVDTSVQLTENHTKEIQVTSDTDTSKYSIVISQLKDVATSTPPIKNAKDSLDISNEYSRGSTDTQSVEDHFCYDSEQVPIYSNKSTQSPPITYRKCSSSISDTGNVNSDLMNQQITDVYKSKLIINNVNDYKERGVTLTQYSNRSQQTDDQITNYTKSQELNSDSNCKQLSINNSKRRIKSNICLKKKSLDKADISKTIDFIISDAFKIVLRLKSSSISNKSSTETVSSESKMHIEAFKNRLLTCTSRLSVPLLLENKKSLSSNKFWIPPSYDENEFTVYSPSNVVLYKQRNNFNNHIQESSSIFKNSMVEHIYSTNMDNKDNLLNENSDVLSIEPQETPFKPMVLASTKFLHERGPSVNYLFEHTDTSENHFGVNHDNESYIFPGTNKESITDKSTAHNEQTCSKIPHGYAQQVLVEPKENEDKVCWALTRLKTHRDGSRDIEILETSPIPPGHFLVPTANSVILLGNQPYLYGTKNV